MRAVLLALPCSFLLRWAMAVEAAISLQLNAFLVHTMADGRLLRQMIAQQFQGGAARGCSLQGCWLHASWRQLAAGGGIPMSTSRAPGSPSSQPPPQLAPQSWASHALPPADPPPEPSCILPPAGIGGIRPSVFVVNFDLPQHVIPPASQPPPAIPTIYRVLRCADRKVAAPILNNLVDQAHIGGRLPRRGCRGGRA